MLSNAAAQKQLITFAPPNLKFILQEKHHAWIPKKNIRYQTRPGP